MTTLARWRAAQINEQGYQEKERRPFLATECTDLNKAEKWRTEIIREIARKVSQIQNAGLGEFRIRDLNDEINKLIREKGHWEHQIRDLGGPDYSRVGPRMLDHEGKEVPGNRGYKYFGAAKDLPGVRELFEQEPPPPPRKTKAELMKFIDADYYGYRDDDDGVLIPLEQQATKIAVQKALETWTQNAESGTIQMEQEDSDEEEIYATSQDNEKSEDEESLVKPELSATDDNDSSKLSENRFIAHVPVPSQKEIEMALLQRKKQELLQRYTSAILIKEEHEAKDLLGLKDNDENKS